MNWPLHLAAAAVLIAAGGAMAWLETVRAKAGRAFLRNEYSQVSYWMTYLSLLVLGASFAAAALIR
jgi:hypothetical protein